MARKQQMRAVTSRQHDAYAEIIEMIRNGALTAEQPVSEADIARKLGVSRTPIREAVLRLKSEGWLSDDGGPGLVVRGVASDGVQTCYVLRECLEGAAARIAATRSGAPELLALRETASAFAQAVEAGTDVDGLAAINRHFHFLLHRCCNSPTLDRILEPLALSLGQFRRSLYEHPGHAQRSALDHEAIVKAIERGDEAEAERLARQHIRIAAEIRLRFIAEELTRSGQRRGRGGTDT